MSGNHNRKPKLALQGIPLTNRHFIIESLFYNQNVGKMTKLIFLLDENSLAALEIPRPAEELAAALRRGDALLEAGAFNQQSQPGWRVLLLGNLVIVDLEPGAAAPPSLPPALEPPLTPRQRQVLDLLRQGLTTRQIALRLKISIRSVHFHVAALKAALGAQTRAQTIWLAGEREENTDRGNA
jgi:DNA-binding CsgD family transcriptional regulator